MIFIDDNGIREYAYKYATRHTGGQLGQTLLPVVETALGVFQLVKHEDDCCSKTKVTHDSGHVFESLCWWGDTNYPPELRKSVLFF